MDIANEIWKSPKSLGCKRIEVSNLGRVRTKDSTREYFRLGRFKADRIEGKTLKVAKDTRGRYCLAGSTVSKKFSGKGFLIHRLVAECFVRNPKPAEYDMVFFKDNDVSNCRADNLVWGSRREKNAKRRGMNSKFIITVMKDGILLGEFLGCAEVGRFLGVTRQAVDEAIKRGIFKCRGFDIVVKDRKGAMLEKSIEMAKKTVVDEGHEITVPDELFA